MGLPDTKANRAKAQRLADVISAEIRAKRFTADRYRVFFPFDNRAAEFAALIAGPEGRPAMRAPTLDEYANLWLPRQRPPLVRPAQRRD